MASARLAAVSRHLSSSSATTAPVVQNVTLFGAGLMGTGIAQVAAQNGFKVVLCDVTQKALDNGHNIIHKSLSRIAKSKYPGSQEEQQKFISSVLANVTTTTDPVAAISKSDLVVEAIIENIKIKQDLFALLDRNAPKTCLFATNTSALSVAEIASTCSLERKQRFGGLHFFNRQYKPQMKLVEVVRTADTSQETYEALIDFSRRLNKRPVTCKDTPGFIVNRLLIPYLREAIAMFERGDASAEDIDIAMKLGAGYPMGPLELTDFIGLDTSKFIADGWRERIEASEEELHMPLHIVKPSPLMEKLVSEGKLGRKTGEGIFRYTK